MIAAAVATLALSSVSACHLENPGTEPPPATVYFPNALALSPAPAGEPARFLFVANSNFDRRYKAGTLQAYSLDRLHDAIEDRCEDGRSCVIDPTLAMEDEVLIGSFSSALAVSPRGRHVFFTTRTDDSLGYVPLDLDADGDAVLDCGREGRECGLFAERGVDPHSGEPIGWPREPASIVALPPSDLDPDRLPEADRDVDDYVLVAHATGAATLFQPTAAGRGSEFVLGAAVTGLPRPLTGVAFDDSTGLAYFSVAQRGLARVGVALRSSDGPAPPEGLLYNAGIVQLEATGFVPFTRDLTFLRPGVLSPAGSLSPLALVVAQSPSALLAVDVNETRGEQGAPANIARVERTAVVGAGAARIAVGEIGGRPIAVVACFDARQLFIVDLTTMLPRGVVTNLSGPFEIVIDEAREALYAADFRSSVVRIVDLSPLARGSGMAPVSVVAALGEFRVLQELR